MLVDLMLGGVDGFTFIRRARPLTEAPIVVISARDGVEDIVAALEAGADDYVTKPFDVEEVKAGSGRCCAVPPCAVGRRPTQDRRRVRPRRRTGPLVFDRGAARR